MAKIEYEVSIVADSALDVKRILTDAGLNVVHVRSIPDFDEWLNSLPDKPVQGLADAAAQWINTWGNGGGDCSTVVSVQEVCTTDAPKELAESICRNIAGYSKSPFDAKELVMLAINDCIAKLKY